MDAPTNPDIHGLRDRRLPNWGRYFEFPSGLRDGMGRDERYADPESRYA